MVIDCRFLPNPHYVDELRPLSGLDAAVADFVMAQPVTAEFLDRLESLLALLVPQYVSEGKSYLTVAFGCTGGRHRSVAVTEHFARGAGRHGPPARDHPPRHRQVGARSEAERIGRSSRQLRKGIERGRGPSGCERSEQERALGHPPGRRPARPSLCPMSIRVGINGFGRIGRNFYRAAGVQARASTWWPSTTSGRSTPWPIC